MGAGEQSEWQNSPSMCVSIADAFFLKLALGRDLREVRNSIISICKINGAFQILKDSVDKACL